MGFICRQRTLTPKFVLTFHYFRKIKFSVQFVNIKVAIFFTKIDIWRCFGLSFNDLFLYFIQKIRFALLLKSAKLFKIFLLYNYIIPLKYLKTQFVRLCLIQLCKYRTNITASRIPRSVGRPFAKSKILHLFSSKATL